MRVCACVCVRAQRKDIEFMRRLTYLLFSKLEENRSRFAACKCVAVCCSVLQCVALCCSPLQCVAVRYSVSHADLSSRFTACDIKGSEMREGGGGGRQTQNSIQ